MRSCALLLVAFLSPALDAQNVRGTAISPVPGMPFTGMETIVWTHKVDDRTVTAQIVGTIARDSEGRIYREVHRFTINPVNPKTNLISTAVNDPVAGTTTNCDLSTHFCRITTFPAATVAKTSSGNDQRATEGLGSQVIGGLTATGTRITRNIQFNAPDDDQITAPNDVGILTTEIWRSDDLKADMSQLRKNPSGEVQDVRLTITSRAEPDPNIFAVPKDFVVRDVRAIRQIGHNVSAPILIYSVAPGFTDEAKRKKTSGNVLVNMVVDPNGIPTSVRVLRGIGSGLDEEAVKAVKKYRFKPAMDDVGPVPVELNMEINFQVF
jgi:TonB family protein